MPCHISQLVCKVATRFQRLPPYFRGPTTRCSVDSTSLFHKSKSHEGKALITGSRHQVNSFDSSTGSSVARSIVPFVDEIKLLGATVDN